MNRFAVAALVLYTATLGFLAGQAPTPIPMEPCSVAVFFSPKGGCTKAIVSEIDGAEHEIQFQAYSFTSKPIRDAFIRALERGVEVSGSIDKTNQDADRTIADELVDKGATVRIDRRHPISHNKLIIIDRKTVIGGSFNYSAQAETNAENLTIISGDKTVKKFLDNWTIHFDHSVVVTFD